MGRFGLGGGEPGFIDQPLGRHNFGLLSVKPEFKPGKLASTHKPRGSKLAFAGNLVERFGGKGPVYSHHRLGGGNGGAGALDVGDSLSNHRIGRPHHQAGIIINHRGNNLPRRNALAFKHEDFPDNALGQCGNSCRVGRGFYPARGLNEELAEILSRGGMRRLQWGGNWDGRGVCRSM